jgi:hypothetical protein
MKQKFIIVLAMSLLAGPMTLPAFAGDPRGIEFLEDTISWETYVPCLGEYIAGQDVIQVRFHEFQTASGTHHIVGGWKMTSFWEGMISGNEWVGHANSPGEVNQKLEAGWVEQFVSNYHMDPLDEGAPRIAVQFRFKLTINANGELIVERFQESYRCLGRQQ